MNVKRLKELIKDLPDETIVCVAEERAGYVEFETIFPTQAVYMNTDGEDVDGEIIAFGY